MAKAKIKTAAVEVVTIDERVKKFETLVKAAMEQCQVGMSLAITGPWENNNKIEAVLRYVDLTQVNNGKTEDSTQKS